MHLQIALFYLIMLVWVVVTVRDAASDKRGGRGSIIPNLCLGILMLVYLYPYKATMAGSHKIYYDLQSLVYILAPVLLFVFYWFNWRPRVQKRNLNRVYAFLMYALMSIGFVATIALSILTIIVLLHNV